MRPGPSSDAGSFTADSSSAAKRPRLDAPNMSSPQTVPVEVSIMPTRSASPPAVSMTALEDFVHPYFGDLPAPNTAGLRRYLGRDWVEVQLAETEGRHHVCVEFDAHAQAYRVVSLRRAGLGPPIYRTPQDNLWSLDRPLPTPDLHVKADAPLAHWSDQDILQLYIIENAQIAAFRAAAQHSGKAPAWAQRAQNVEDYIFVADSLKWSEPQLDSAQRAELLRSYNLSKAQLSRLRSESIDGQMPEWAQQHQRLTLDSSDEQRFRLIAEELKHYVHDLRSQGLEFRHDWPATRYSDAFLSDYATHLGYLRTRHNMLYRTDIPALFRGETRLPFELARDGRMIYRKGNPAGTTNQRALSATFGLQDATAYAANRGGFYHELHYNTQANRFPGVNPQSSKANTGESSDSGGSSVSDGKRTGDEADSDSSFVFDDTQGYASKRRQQTTTFVYVIDTRGLEVVPGAENKAFNPGNGKFLFDNLEAHISMPSRGISAERLWLVRSDLSKAARVKDVLEQAGGRAATIEQATWAGTDNRAQGYFGDNVYDRLIDEIASSGGAIVDLPKGDKTFADDVVWPLPAHGRP